MNVEVDENLLVEEVGEEEDNPNDVVPNVPPVIANKDEDEDEVKQCLTCCMDISGPDKVPGPVVTCSCDDKHAFC